jgi:hypothetical protein
VLCHHQLRAEATLRCAGLLRAQVAAPRQEMPNFLVDLSLRTAHAIGLLRATQSPMGGADRVGHGI